MITLRGMLPRVRGSCFSDRKAKADRISTNRAKLVPCLLTHWVSLPGAGTLRAQNRLEGDRHRHISALRLVSMVVALANRELIEIGIIGRESMLGTSVASDGGVFLNQANEE
jgi:hypothetical protein